MPSRTRIIFVDPIDSLNAGRKVAHMGKRAVDKLLEMYRMHRGRYATVPPGSPAQRAQWAWNQLMKEERAGSALYILRERRGRPWVSSSARPENLGFWQADYPWKKAKVAAQPGSIFSVGYATIAEPPTYAQQVLEHAAKIEAKIAKIANKPAPKKRPRVEFKKWDDPETGYSYKEDSTPSALKGASGASTYGLDMPNRQKKRRNTPPVQTEAPPKKRLQIGVWS